MEGVKKRAFIHFGVQGFYSDLLKVNFLRGQNLA